MIPVLTRDYWGDPAVPVWPRLLAGLMLAPLTMALVVFMALVLADLALSGDARAAWARAMPLMAEIILFSYVVTLTLGIAAILVLWSFGMRQKRAYFIAGLIVGALAVFAFSRLNNVEPGGGLLIVISLHFAAILLMLRWIAGVKRLA